LYADRSRQLPVADPLGRSLLLSCGSALRNAVVAAEGAGFSALVERMPDGPGSDRLAVLRLAPALVTQAAADELDALQRRCTDRRRFTSWPIPDEHLAELAQAVTTDRVIAVPLTEPRQRSRTEALVEQAMGVWDRDPRFADEQARWMGAHGGAGIPLGALIPFEHGPNDTPNRYVGQGGPRLPSSERIEGSDGLIVLATVDDDPSSWLRCGEALGALWLRAAMRNLSIVPLSQVIEVEETRRALEHDVLGRAPQILVRVGWQEISRGALPRTPRRGLDEVLLG
jgi:hypothetical protein